MSDHVFPIIDSKNHEVYVPEGYGGLSKRELFAAMMAQGILANDLEYKSVAKEAVDYADALIAELEKP